MNEYTKKRVRVIIGLAFFLISFMLVIFGHSYGATGGIETGMAGLGIQLLGVAGILILLYLYNKPYAK